MPVLAQFYPAKVYSIREGMPTNAIYDITQSPDGVMWFLTAKGVVSYNSLNWQLYPDSMELPSTPFSVIESSEDGNIWVAGQNNASFVIKYLQNEQWNAINIPELPEIDRKFSFALNKASKGYDILIGDRQTIYTYNTFSKAFKRRPIGSSSDLRINAIGFKNNQAHIATSSGLFILDSILDEHPVNNLISGDKEILQFHRKGDELLLLGIGWLGKYKSGKFDYLSTNTGVTKVSPFNKHNLTTDQFDRVFYSSNSAAKYFEKQSKSERTLYVNGRVFNALSNRIYVDLENNVWVGDHRGLFKFNVLRFKNFNENTGLKEDEVTSILQCGDEIILANARHLNVLQEDIITKRISIGQGSGVRILDMAKDAFGMVYIAAAQAGLLKYDGKKIEKIDCQNSDHELEPTSVAIFKEILFFTSNEALYCMKDGQIEEKMKISNIRNLQYLEEDSLLAISTSQGLFFYDPLLEDTTHFVASDRKYDNVYGVAHWKGQYYLGTAGGLAVLTNKEITPITLDTKLNRVAVYTLMVSDNNRLWLGTNEGAFIWNDTTLVNYNRSFGLVGDEVNRNALIQDMQGKIWIGTELGASVYNYNEDKSIKIEPKIHFTSATTQNGTPLIDGNRDLAYDDNTIDFKFLGISFFDERQITYRYQLRGFDKDWIEIDNPNANSIRYTNLAPGDYEFLVAAGISGTNYSETAHLKFQIHQPFYFSSWFILSAIVFTLVLLYFAYRIRFYVIIKNQKKLQKEVTLRTQEIQEMNKEIQAQNEELRTQSEEIFTTNERLEEIVQDRTSQLRRQNEKLSEYAFINSHQLRAPICRMIGLLNLLKISPKEEHGNILDLLHETGMELDKITKDINSRLEDVDFSKLEEENSIEVINAQP